MGLFKGSVFDNTVEVDSSGNATVDGNLTVNGTTTTISTTNTVAQTRGLFGMRVSILGKRVLLLPQEQARVT
jgi:hypothetical protein